MECRLEKITVHYETAGTGRPLIVLHGWSDDHHACMRVMEPLLAERSGWRRFYPDLPGTGRTAGMDWIANQDDVLGVVADFIEAVVPGQRVCIVGCSYGGYLVQGIVYQRPELVDGVCLFVPAVYDSYLAKERQHPLPHQVTLFEDKALLQELTPDELEGFQSGYVVQNRKTLACFRDWYNRGRKTADEVFLSRLRENVLFSFDVRSLPEPFPRPALILTGRQDSALGYRDAWDILGNYPRATFAVLDRAGHALVFEQEQLLDALFNEWLDRVEERG